MAIMPVEGFVGSHMLQQVIPWSPSRGNLLKRWFLMLGASLGAPVRLAQGLPPTRGLSIGIIFLLVNLAVFGLFMALPLFLLTGIALGGMTGTGGGPMLYQALLQLVVFGGTFIFGVLVSTLVVGLLVHVMIVLTGRHEKGLSATLASLMVTSGPLCVLVCPLSGSVRVTRYHHLVVHQLRPRPSRRPWDFDCSFAHVCTGSNGPHRWWFHLP